MLNKTSNQLNKTEISVTDWEQLVKESFNPQSSLLTVFHILIYLVPIMLIFYLCKCLNNTKTCNAMKGATMNKITHVHTGASRWIHKRSVDFDTFHDPPKRAESFRFVSGDATELRPVQAAAMAHRAHTRTANIPFTTEFLQAQQRVANIQPTLYPATSVVQEEEYTSMEPVTVSQPPAYSSQTYTKSTPTHHYNTRSQSRLPEVRNPQPVSSPVPNQRFEMH
jgi:hypothetical protein